MSEERDDAERYTAWIAALGDETRMLVFGTTDLPAWEDMTAKDRRRWRYFKATGAVAARESMTRRADESD